MSPELPRLPRAETLAGLPPEWPGDAFAALQALLRERPEAIAVLDDDPTGTQTVHGVPVLTEWSTASLQAELARPGPPSLFYVLTNSRSLPPAEAEALNTEAGRSLAQAARATGRRLAVISRSDSTLRGHYPGEVEALARGLDESFDATLLAPAFIEGRRFTIGDVHYVAEGDWLVPAGQTEFARDAVFHYSASNLREWVCEKSGGRIPAETVGGISLDELRRGGPEVVTERLMALPRGSVLFTNAASDQDLAVFALGAAQAEASSRRYLYRTAASFVRLRAGLAARSLLTAEELALPVEGGGLIVAGSYVPKTTRQLAAVQSLPDISTVQVEAKALIAGETREAEIQQARDEVEAGLTQGREVLLFTSRQLITGSGPEDSLALGRAVSSGLVEIVKGLEVRPRYLIAKGGITSSDTATAALGVRRAMVLGQLLAGVPVWRLGSESRWPDLAYVVFPGNVGGENALADVITLLRH